MNPRRRVVAGAALVLVGLVFAWASAAPAAATTLVPGAPALQRTIVLGRDSTSVTPLAVDRLAPGSSVTQRLLLRLGADVLSGRPAVQIDDVRDLERGCIHPEVAAGDVTCGPGDDQGELSKELLVGVVWQPPTDGNCPSATDVEATTTMAAAAGITQASTTTSSGANRDTCMALTLTLPRSADNLVQGDAVRFDLRVGLLDPMHRGDQVAAGHGLLSGHTTEAAGSPGSSSAGAAVGAATARVLPFTGRRLLPLALLGLGLLLLGSVATSCARARRVPGVPVGIATTIRRR